MPKIEVSPGVTAPRRSLLTGFTLVELLVVIGIIALLIGILLPTLANARENAKRVACLAKLQQIMIAANLHVAEHKGYYPLAGQLNGDGGLMNPSGLQDTYCAHYTWFSWSGLAAGQDQRLIAPITFALGTEMGFNRNLGATNDATQLSADMDNLGVIRHFLCPSQAGTVTEIRQLCWLYAGYLPSQGGVGYTEQMSYVFNEYVVGYDDQFSRLRGQASRVKQPARTFFAADGLGGSTKTRTSGGWAAITSTPGAPPAPWPTLTIWNNQPNSKATGIPYSGAIPLSYALLKKTGGSSGSLIAGDAENFDSLRHKGKINIAFCDGHVETRVIPDINKNPTASSLADIFIMPPP